MNYFVNLLIDLLSNSKNLCRLKKHIDHEKAPFCHQPVIAKSRNHWDKQKISNDSLSRLRKTRREERKKSAPMLPQSTSDIISSIVFLYVKQSVLSRGKVIIHVAIKH